MIPCPHYSPRSAEGGVCNLGYFGGRPSHGTCLVCLKLGHNTSDAPPDAPGRIAVTQRPATPPTAPAPLSVPATTVSDLPLGDLVRDVTKMVGIEQLTRWLSGAMGVNCGCAARQERWNRAGQALYDWLHGGKEKPDGL